MKHIQSAIFVAIIKIMNCEANRILSAHAIIPEPRIVIPHENEEPFSLAESSKIFVLEPAFENVAFFLRDCIRTPTGYDIPNVLGDVSSTDQDVSRFVFRKDINEHKIGWYHLDISANTVIISAGEPTGAFYAVQTLRQLFPPSIQSKSVVQNGSWALPCGVIEDYPEYAHRGAMLDVVRHFFPCSVVKRFIDLLAFYKFNVLHLHLTDDQGWRIEIKSWPLLAEVGSRYQVGGGRGSFFTQIEYSDMVEYASSRFITIIPEIDMPGHTNAALASYGFLNPGIIPPENGRREQTNKVYENPSYLYSGMACGFSYVNVHHPDTFRLFRDVISELAAITPGPYLHIGGDETVAMPLEEYRMFVEEMQKTVKENGKISIGWDEIASADLLEGTIVQHWAHSSTKAHAALAVSKGRKLVMSPAAHTYLDMKYSASTPYGLSWAGYLDIDKAYNWDPSELVSGVKKDDIIGIEAPLWTETIDTVDIIEYMVLPRLTAISEVGWAPQDKRNLFSFLSKVAKHGESWMVSGTNFFRSELVPWSESCAAI